MTIGEFIAQQGAQFKVFDMGRRVSEVPLEHFAEVEAMTTPYFSPYLKHAWITIMAWNPSKPGQHNIWFLKLPLDEQNLLQYADRDAFVAHWLRLTQHPNQEIGEPPCSYKPDAHRMAYFHALALQALGQPVSKYYQATRSYLSGELGYDNWKMLGLQGFAEVVSRIADDQNNQLIAQALSKIPTQPRIILLGFLENAVLDQLTTTAINDALAKAVAAPIEVEELAAFVRALSQSSNVQQRRDLLSAILQHEHRYQVELLAAIGSRCWQDLHGDLLLQYLECLARNEQGSNVFNAVISDLLAMPGVRHHFVLALSSPQKTQELTDAFERLLASVGR